VVAARKGKLAVSEDAPEIEAEEGEANEPSELTNKSVIKAATLLTELGRHLDGITVTELAQHVGMSRPTVFRLLLSLEQTGFVERFDAKYRLGWRVARLGRLADPYRGIISRLQPTLRALADEFNEMIGYAVYGGDGQFDLVAEAHSTRLISLTKGYIGTEFPAHASATGKMALAELSDEELEARLPKTLPKFASRTITDRSKLIRALQEVRKQNYATVDDELEESLFAISVPVRDERGDLIGLLSVTGPSERMKKRPLHEIADQLHVAAADIARILSASR
jgi:DNA-binding IclR family transcriptional regulator